MELPASPDRARNPTKLTVAAGHGVVSRPCDVPQGLDKTRAGDPHAACTSSAAYAGKT